MLTLAKESGNDPFTMLPGQRNIPSAMVEYSRSQRLFGMRRRTLLPAIGDLLEPKVQPPDGIKFSLRQHKFKGCHAKDLSKLKEGENLWVQDVPKGYQVPRKQVIRNWSERHTRTQKQTAYLLAKGRQLGDYEPRRTQNRKNQKRVFLSKEG